MPWPIGITRFNYWDYISITPEHFRLFPKGIPTSLFSLDVQLGKKRFPQRSKPFRDPNEMVKLIGGDQEIFCKTNELIRKGKRYEKAIYEVAENPKSYETVKKIYNLYSFRAYWFAGKTTPGLPIFNQFRGRPPTKTFHKQFARKLLKGITFSHKKLPGRLTEKEWKDFYSYLNICYNILQAHLPK